MSGARGCRCPKSPTQRAGWRVVTYRANHSAFNGYKRTPSDYSEVQCTNCSARWRTKAGYVALLPFAPGA